MVILVTGSSGRVGSAIAQLLTREHDVRGLDLVPGPFTTDRASILDEHRVRAAAHGADAIVHVAALHAPHLKTHSSGAFAATNVDGTRVVLDAALPRYNLPELLADTAAEGRLHDLSAETPPPQATAAGRSRGTSSG